jgi:hypothetical protein
MLQDAKVGTLIGIESHLYEDCPALFTAKSNEKTKLIFIDKAGFDLYFKDFLLKKQLKIMNFFQQVVFLQKTKVNFRALLKLVLMSEYKTVLANTCVVKQGDLCKYLYFIAKGRFIVARSLDFIEDLTAPLEEQMNFVEGVPRDVQLLSEKL